MKYRMDSSFLELLKWIRGVGNKFMKAFLILKPVTEPSGDDNWQLYIWVPVLIEEERPRSKP